MRALRLAPQTQTVGLEGPVSGGLRVALVCMPFCAVDRPSIQLGLLAATARRVGFEAETFHLNLELAARIPDAYDGLCSHTGHMTGEWLFGVAAFGAQAKECPDAAYFEAFPEELSRAARGNKDGAYLSRLRHEVLPSFVDDCLTMVDWERFGVVGFTSTFQQNVASLALARRIKQAHPHVRIIMGGANMEDEMGPEYARAFPFIDYVVVGEGETVFCELLQALAAGRPPSRLPGLISRDGDTIHHTGQAPPNANLDLLPIPLYDEYFNRAKGLRLQLASGVGRVLPVETSRGCWWGQKHHCTFCGLNGLGMGYRSKSPARVLEELAHLSRRHRLNFFGVTDNILDMKHIQPLFGTIAENRIDYQFFYEIKANVTPAQLRTLRLGGIRWVQPGIESMSTHVLRLMRKGSTMLQNLRLLKWCRYYRIRVSWNLIWGFPGETEDDYRDELRVLKLISHLEPPHASTRIWLERFSPYFFDRDQFPVHDLHAEASYHFAYPASLGLDLDKIAYFFDYQMDATVPDDVHQPTQSWVDEWQRRHRSNHPDTLVYRRTSDAVFIDDNRGPDRCGSHAFYGPLAQIYEYCSETMRTPASVAAHLNATNTHRYNDHDAHAALEEFCARGLMVTEDNHYLSLAIPANPNW